MLNRSSAWALACTFLAVGCDETDADEGAAAACPVTEDPSEEACGTYVDTDEGCDGGGESGGVCNDEITDSNDAVVACVAQAAADGRPFAVAFSYYRNGGQFDTTRTHHVSANGDAWNRYTGYDDLCTVEETTALRGVSLAALAQCDAWSCIESALGDAETVDSCENEMNCDGV